MLDMDMDDELFLRVDAACRWRPELPWTADDPPGAPALLAMRDVCLSCPVLMQCADQALEPIQSGGAVGGFYAGMWIPWFEFNQRDRRRSGLTWYTARVELRRRRSRMAEGRSKFRARESEWVEKQLNRLAAMEEKIHA